MPNSTGYHLNITAGPSYTSHTPVPVNTCQPIRISTPHAECTVQVHIRNFRGPPNSSYPTSSPYFSHPSRSNALYAIRFTVTPRGRSIPSTALVFGNDFDEPIRALLPPFFGAALAFVKKYVDPGLNGDPYAEKPYIYAPCGGSVNVLRVGGRSKDGVEEGAKGGPDEGEELKEGAKSEEAWEQRRCCGMPDQTAGRRKWFLNGEKKDEWVWENGRTYEFDFFNGYLDFNEFTLKLPLGLSFSLLNNLREDEIQPLRYALRDESTNNLLFHITFAMVPKSKSPSSDYQSTSDRGQPQKDAEIDDELD